MVQITNEVMMRRFYAGCMLHFRWNYCWYTYLCLCNERLRLRGVGAGMFVISLNPCLITSFSTRSRGGSTFGTKSPASKPIFRGAQLCTWHRCATSSPTGNSDVVDVHIVIQSISSSNRRHFARFCQRYVVTNSERMICK
jgi:hypothetical protein